MRVEEASAPTELPFTTMSNLSKLRQRNPEFLDFWDGEINYSAATKAAEAEGTTLAVLEGEELGAFYDRRIEYMISEEPLLISIPKNWAEHKSGRAAVMQSQEELAAVKLKLASDLAALKYILARTGRLGKWSPFLRKHRIPRATADRYVKSHKNRVNVVHQTSASPTPCKTAETQVSKIVERLLPRLKRELQTSDDVELFLNLLGTALKSGCS